MATSKTVSAGGESALRHDTELSTTLGMVHADDLRALLKISPGTFANRQSRGELPPYYRIGNQKCFRVVDIEQWLLRHRNDPAPQRGRYERGPHGSYRLKRTKGTP
jgi:hypothetical protein